jgi:hypothetical protein
MRPPAEASTSFFYFFERLAVTPAYSIYEGDAFIRQNWARVALGTNPEQFDGKICRGLRSIHGTP